MDIRRTGEPELERLSHDGVYKVTSSIREWLNLLVRWLHVFAAIMWVGQTYYFTWLDGQFTRLAKNVATDGTAPSIWMVHSGGFYTVDKQQSLKVAPDQVRWFRWEALMTWLSGMVLPVLVYYSSSGLIDPILQRFRKRVESRLDWLYWLLVGSCTTWRCDPLWASRALCLPHSRC